MEFDFLTQTCIAPDYILCNKKQRDALISNMVPLLKEWLGDRPEDSKDFGRIVNERHFDRVMNLLHNTTGTVAHGKRALRGFFVTILTGFVTRVTTKRDPVTTMSRLIQA